MRRSVSSGEFLFSLCIVASGLTISAIASGYRLGHLGNIGPGLFPLAIGVLIVLIGAFLGLSSFASTCSATRLSLRPAIFVPLAIIVWALTIERAGLVPATLALVLLSACAEARGSFLAALVLGLVLGVAGTVVFIYGFRMPFDALPW